MSYYEFESKWVQCRKAHRCGWCNEPIEKNDTAHYRSYMWDDGPQSDWMHPECMGAMMDYEPASDLLDGWIPGDFERGSTEG